MVLVKTVPRRSPLLVGLLITALAAQAQNTPPAPPPGMVLIPGGEFMMGSDDKLARPDERPVHRVKVDAFYMDATEVTNAEFSRFIDATGYVTTAEMPPKLDEIMAQLPPGTPPPAAGSLKPGALVFTAPKNPGEYWWKWVEGADWRHPQGPGSTLAGKESHPVVQVSWDDAVAYAAWAGKRLPTEAEWEYAARGGLKGQLYVWGHQDPYSGKPRANIWQGRFPTQDEGRDGYAGTAPVKSFSANPYGLYDMTGNVWEWVQDWYRADAYEVDAKQRLTVNPQGPMDSLDPAEPTIKKRSQRGGSFLCDRSYCASYRPSARMKASPDTGLVHTGFRCVKSLRPDQ